MKQGSLGKNNLVPKRKNQSLQKKMSIHGYVFTAPFVIGFLVLFVPVIVDSIRLSFHDLNLTTEPYTLVPVGWEHYRFALMGDPDFVQTVISTVGSMLMNIPIIIIFSLFIATVLNQKMRGRAFFRAVFFVPVILATGIVARAELGNYVMNAAGSGVDIGDSGTASAGMQVLGSIESYLMNMTFNQTLVEYITAAVQGIYDVVNYSGVQILLFLSGLQAISPAIYEAASIEGATGWEAFWKITFPMISPVIMVNVVYSVIDAFTRSDNPIMLEINGLVGQQGLGSAMAWIYFLVVAAVLGVIFLILSRFVFYQQRN